MHAVRRTARTGVGICAGRTQDCQIADLWRRPVLWLLPVAAVITELAVAVVSVWSSQPDAHFSSPQRRLDLTYKGIETMAQADQWWRFYGPYETPEMAGTLAYADNIGFA